MRTLVKEYVESRHWAMLDEYLALMVAVVERDLNTTDDTMELIQRRLGTPVYGTRETMVSGGVAVVPVAGPLFRYANLFTEISGATSYERLASDIGIVMDDPEVTHVVFDINSPGGEVDGASELAALIASYRGVKPMTAFVSGLGASAAFWIAAAADRIVIADTGMAGSIGAVLAVANRADEDEEVLEFVSSFAPDKRLDPFSPDADEATRARAKLQALVDKVGTVFAENVADLRGMTVEDVMATRGGMFVGTDAVGAGLADDVGTLEQLVSALIGDSDGIASRVSLAAVGLQHSTGEVSMDDDKVVTAPVIDRAFLASNHSDLVDEIRAEAAEAERTRILAIHDLDAQGFDALKREAMGNPDGSSGTAAQAILMASGEQEKRRSKAAQDALDADEGDLKELTSSTLPAEEVDEEDQAVASIQKWMPSAQAQAHV